jgi:hypothetical protein
VAVSDERRASPFQTPPDDDADDDPVLTTVIDGEEVRLLVHIEPLEDAEANPEDPPTKPE